jgi:general secretion pathway protein B
MSYILDALRRADAERQRGGVPDLHAQPAGPMGASLDTRHDRPGGRRRLLLGAGLAALVLVALAVAWWLGREAAADHAAPPQLAQPGATAPAVPEPAVPAAAPSAALTAPAWPPVGAPAPAVAVAPAATAPASTATATPAAVTAVAPPASAPTATPPLAARPASVPPVAAAATAAAASAGDAPLRWAALPEATRRSLPPLSWSGAVYADQPAQRLVVVNGQVAREGDELAPGLRLERIAPKSVVLRWRGQRIEMPM